MTLFIIIAVFTVVFIIYSVITLHYKMNKIRQLKPGDSIYVINYDDTNDAGVMIYEKCKIVEVCWTINNKLDSVIIINQTGKKEIFTKEFVISNDFIIPIKF